MPDNYLPRVRHQYEALPYPRLGTQKYDFLSREYAMGDVSLPDGVAQRIQLAINDLLDQPG